MSTTNKPDNDVAHTSDTHEVAEAFHSATSRLDRIVEQLQGIHVSLENLRVSLTGLSQTADDHETRLRRLESWSHRLSPLVSLITFAAGVVVSATITGWMGG